MKFRKHYTRGEVRALLPRVRSWLEQLVSLRKLYAKLDQRVEGSRREQSDTGGATVNGWVRALADIQQVLREFESREIQIKDLDRGLVDFPAILNGKEVFLCWENGEEDVEFWHDLDSGYAGREPL